MGSVNSSGANNDASFGESSAIAQITRPAPSNVAHGLALDFHAFHVKVIYFLDRLSLNVYRNRQERLLNYIDVELLNGKHATFQRRTDASAKRRRKKAPLDDTLYMEARKFISYIGFSRNPLSNSGVVFSTQIMRRVAVPVVSGAASTVTYDYDKSADNDAGPLDKSTFDYTDAAWYNVDDSVVKLSLENMYEQSRIEETQGYRELRMIQHVTDTLYRTGRSPGIVRIYSGVTTEIDNVLFDAKRMGESVATGAFNAAIAAAVYQRREDALPHEEPDLRRMTKEQVRRIVLDEYTEEGFDGLGDDLGDAIFTLQENAGDLTYRGYCQSIVRSTLDNTTERMFIVTQLLFSLHQLHSKSRVIHGDLQASNVVLKRSTAQWNTFYALEEPLSSTAMQTGDLKYYFFGTLTRLMDDDEVEARANRSENLYHREASTKPLVVKVIDFETTRDTDERFQLTRPTSQIDVRAPEHYVSVFDDNESDERYNQRLSFASDIFAVGVLCAELFVIPATRAYMISRGMQDVDVNVLNLMYGSYLFLAEPYRNAYRLISNIVYAALEAVGKGAPLPTAPSIRPSTENDDFASVEINDLPRTIASHIMYMGLPASPQELGIDMTKEEARATSFMWSSIFAIVEEQMATLRVYPLAEKDDMEALRTSNDVDEKGKIPALKSYLWTRMLAPGKGGVLSTILLSSDMNVPREVVYIVERTVRWSPDARTPLIDLMLDPSAVPFARTCYAKRAQTAREFREQRVAEFDDVLQSAPTARIEKAAQEFQQRGYGPRIQKHVALEEYRASAALLMPLYVTFGDYFSEAGVPEEEAASVYKEEDEDDEERKHKPSSAKTTIGASLHALHCNADIGDGLLQTCCVYCKRRHAQFVCDACEAAVYCDAHCARLDLLYGHGIMCRR